jgi:hypothetical protein
MLPLPMMPMSIEVSVGGMAARTPRGAGFFRAHATAVARASSPSGSHDRPRRAAARRGDARRDRHQGGDRERGGVAVDQRGRVGRAAGALVGDGREDRDAERAADVLAR